jgi:hypothetical protein
MMQHNVNKSRGFVDFLSPLPSRCECIFPKGVENEFDDCPFVKTRHAIPNN